MFPLNHDVPRARKANVRKSNRDVLLFNWLRIGRGTGKSRKVSRVFASVWLRSRPQPPRRCSVAPYSGAASGRRRCASHARAGGRRRARARAPGRRRGERRRRPTSRRRRRPGSSPGRVSRLQLAITRQQHPLQARHSNQPPGRSD